MARTPRIGLALGGGGIVGYSFHAGVLGSIQEATGWDPRTADVIIGTSAGSSIASIIRGHVSVPTLVERILSVPNDPVDMDKLRRVSGRGQSIMWRGWIGPSSPRLVARELTRLHHVRPMRIVAGALPNGRVINDVVGEQAAALHGAMWPERTTWVPAVALDNGRVTVFGRDDFSTDLGTAVAASCAIPGFFRPVTIGGRKYVDGGIRSMVNLDLLADLDLDLVVVVSPMSSDGYNVRSPLAAAMRCYPKFQLSRELAILREAGIETMSFEPDQPTVRAMGLNPMDPTKVVPVLTAAAVAAARDLTKPAFEGSLALLAEAGRNLESPADVPYPD